jgi:glycosyltransferase involved in cell wall biosynthesis/polysaccharide pyruvyl transferase WcaK-like protein
MRFVYILNGITTEISGGDQHALRLAMHQIDQGKNVEIVTSSNLRLLVTHSEVFQNHVHHIQWVTYDSSDTYPVPKKTAIALFCTYLYRTVASMVRIKKEKDAVYIASSHFFFDVLPLLCVPGSKKYAFVHHIVSDQDVTGIRAWYHKIFESISFAVLKIAHAKLITVSPVITSVLRQKGFTHILESSNGIDDKYFDRGSGEVTQYDIVYCGRLHERKGIYRFVDCINLLEKEGKQYTAAILGSGPEIEQLEVYIKKLGLESRISVLGYVSDVLKKDIYGKAKVFLSASYEEGWGIAIGEALASGLPVISFWSKELEVVWKDSVLWANSVQDALHMVDMVCAGEIKATGDIVQRYRWNTVLESEDVYVSKVYPERDTLVLGSYGRGNIGDDVFLYAVQQFVHPDRIIINCADVEKLPKDLREKFHVIDTHFLKDFFHKLGVLFRVKTVIYVGGDVWTLMYEDVVQRKHLYKMILVNSVLRLLGKKVLYVGTGVGDLDTLSLYMARVSAYFAHYIIFRDQESARRMSLKREKYSVLPDLASVIDVPKKASQKKQIALSLLYHVSDKEKNYPILKRAFVDLIRTYSEKGYSFVFVPMLKTEEILHDDVWVGRDIKKEIQCVDFIVLTDHSVEGVLRAFNESELVVSTRLHAALLSVLVKTPVLAVSYRGKVTRAMTDMGLSEYVLLVDDINKLNSSISYILDTYTEAQKKVEDASQYITTHGHTYRSIISEYIS